MGAKKDFTDEEKAMVTALMGQGLKLREMAEIVGRSISAISRCIKKIRDGVETVRPGRQSIVSERDARRIVREVSNKAISSKRVKANLGLSYSDRTIRRVIKKSGVIIHKKKMRKPILSKAQMQAQMYTAVVL